MTAGAAVPTGRGDAPRDISHQANTPKRATANIPTPDHIHIPLFGGGNRGGLCAASGIGPPRGWAVAAPDRLGPGAGRGAKDPEERAGGATARSGSGSGVSAGSGSGSGAGAGCGSGRGSGTGPVTATSGGSKAVPASMADGLSGDWKLCPHLPQNLTLDLHAAAHWGQETRKTSDCAMGFAIGVGWPHLPQNLAVSDRVFWQLWQRMKIKALILFACCCKNNAASVSVVFLGVRPSRLSSKPASAGKKKIPAKFKICHSQCVRIRCRAACKLLNKFGFWKIRAAHSNVCIHYFQCLCWTAPQENFFAMCRIKASNIEYAFSW